MTDPYPDITGQKCVIVGIQGSGKTTHAKELIKRRRYETLVYAPDASDWKDMPDHTILYKYNDFYGEFEKFIEYAIELGKKGLITCVAIDEFDMLFRTNSDLGRNTNDFILNHRHYGLAMIGLTRRPQDIPTKVFESCLYTFYFSIDAPNLRKKLNDIYPKMGDLVARIPFKSYGYVMKTIGQPPVLCNLAEDKLMRTDTPPYVMAGPTQTIETKPSRRKKTKETPPS